MGFPLCVINITKNFAKIFVNVVNNLPTIIPKVGILTVIYNAFIVFAIPFMFTFFEHETMRQIINHPITIIVYALMNFLGLMVCCMTPIIGWARSEKNMISHRLRSVFHKSPLIYLCWFTHGIFICVCLLV